MKIHPLKAAVAALFVACSATASFGLPIFTPSNANFVHSPSQDPNPNADQIEDYTGTSVELSLLYKKNQGGQEEGNAGYQSAYNTVFANSTSNPEDATISYVSGTPITGYGELWLIVKDGADPRWYLFNISTWNGTDALVMQDFWIGAGAISYVAIYGGGTPTQVPDHSSTLVILGAALTAIGALRRRIRAA